MPNRHFLLHRESSYQVLQKKNLSAAAPRVALKVNKEKFIAFFILLPNLTLRCTMDATNRPSQISLDTLYALTLRYNTQVPVKIQGLEELRIITIPETLTQRKDSAPLLEKTEVTRLVEWKLCVIPINMNLCKP